jgi:hypothetical protein
LEELRNDSENHGHLQVAEPAVDAGPPGGALVRVEPRLPDIGSRPAAEFTVSRATVLIPVVASAISADGYRRWRAVELRRPVRVVRVRVLGVDRVVGGRVRDVENVPALRAPARAAGVLVAHVEVGLAIGAGDGDRHETASLGGS